MIKKLFICIRPNQLEFSLAIKKKLFSNIEIIYICKDQNKNTQNLKKEYNNKITFILKNNFEKFNFRCFNEIYLPYTIDREIYELESIFNFIPKKKIKFFYDGLGSYFFTKKIFIKEVLKKINLNKFYKHTIKDFLGIKEYDIFFNRKTLNQSISLDNIYKQRLKSKKIFKNSKGIFLGQPLVNKILSKKNYYQIIEKEFKKKKVDTYIMHPLEKKLNLKLPEKMKVVSLDLPVENYANLLANKQIIGLYSSALLFFHIKKFKVKVVGKSSIDRKKLPEIYKYISYMNYLINVKKKKNSRNYIGSQRVKKIKK